MILLINICREKLHYLEFVKPIEDVLKINKLKCFIRDYRDIEKKDLERANQAIICGTSLFDNEFLKDVEKFDWIRDFDKPILGICGGMQVIGLVFNSKLKKKTEIGFHVEDFRKEFLGLMGKQKVYHLHNYYVDFSELKEFEAFVKNEIVQAVKHKEKEIYGVLFHPEVRQKSLIKNFACIKLSKMEKKEISDF